MRNSFLLFFLTFFQIAVAQISKIDSLYVAVQNHPQEDTVRAGLLNALSLRIFKNQPDQSLHYAEKALALSQRLAFQKGLGEANNNLAVYYLMKGKHEVSLKFALDAARIGEQKQLKELAADSYSILGTIYHGILDYEKALYYLNKALKLNAEIKNPLIGSKILNALGGIARDKKKYDSALLYYQNALTVLQKGREEYRLPEVINNIGLIYTRQNKNSIALKYYFMSLDAAKKSENRRAEALASRNIGGTLLSERKYDEAEKFLSQSIDLTKEIGDTRMLSINYMDLGQLKSETGKFKDACFYISKAYQLKDSLINLEKAKKIAELEIRYETEKKERTIQLMERDKKIQQMRFSIFMAAFIFTIILFGVIYFIQRYRERKDRHILNLEIDHLTSQHKSLSEKYKDAIAGGDPKLAESGDQRLLKKAIEIVESNMSNPEFGVEEMAKAMSMSRTNLHRKIKGVTGFPPNELIRNIRLRKAAALLLSQADTVAQISFAVGFEDHSYFSKAFKKQFGVSPSEYYQSMNKTGS